MFNGGVPSSSSSVEQQQQQQFHQFITSSNISASSSIAAARIINPNNNNNNNMMLQTTQQPHPPSPIAIHHHHHQSNSSATISSSSPANLNTSTNFLSFDHHHHHHPILFPPPPHHHPLIPTTTNTQQQQQQHQDLFHHHHQPPASNQLILRPPPPTHQQHHHHHHHHHPHPHPQYNNNDNITTSITHHLHDEIRNGDHHEEEEMNDHMIIKEQQLADEDEDSWSNDEVIQLLKIKSTTLISSTTSTTTTDHHQHESSPCWFRPPDDHFHTWNHVSRKLAEMGYKKSAEKCKVKFEEETCRSFGGGYNKNTTSSSSYLIAEELDEHLYSNNDTHGQNSHPPVPIHESPDHNVIDHEQVPQVDDEKEGEDGNLEAQELKGHFDKDPPAEIRVETTQDDDDDEVAKKSKKRKRKHKKFKMVKGLCVELVNRMMIHQEEMHRRLLQDMAIWDEEKIKREEAWRNEELDRVQREIQIREQEHEMAINRQSTITEFLNKITSFDQIPSDINLQDLYNIATNIERPIRSCGTTKTPSAEKFTGNRNQDHQKDDLGKRWPRDEVLALINMRSKVNSGNSEEHQGNDKGGGSLWERISQGMSEVGYKRSAKRCKEKWENINKYFRKTKDANKKRSLDSRTCPYYHELNKLYNQEKLASDEPENFPRPTTTPLN